MTRVTPTRFRGSLLLLLPFLGATMLGAKPVAAVGKASPAYQERKFAHGDTQRETYVVMSGKRYEGATRDGSFERTTIREIAEYLAPQLTKQNYWPTKDPKDADLVLVVHWGVTQPRASLNDMTARTTLGPDLSKSSDLFGDSSALADFESVMGPLGNVNAGEQRMYQLEDIADMDANNSTGASTARLLGYSETLRKMSETPFLAAEQYTLESDLRTERYFIIVRAYDLHAPTKAERSRPVWTLHLNTASPGNNFRTALASMSTAGASLFGHDTEGVSTVRPEMPRGEVRMPDIVIIGETK